MRERARLEFEGIVQGVGFRPFLHKLAAELGLAGWVLNSSAGVVLELEGERAALEQYAERVQREAPPLSRILVLRTRYLPPIGLAGFQIRASADDPNGLTLLCPDVAVCQDCLRELFDPGDRRYRYPFINCTNCGPRYTIVRDLPYDRPRTTMAGFPLCPDCLHEYEDPADRRYHAQPVACPVCGPRLWFEHPAGTESAGTALAQAVELLRDGGIVALKGLGGFHLACRADQDAPLLALRRRKQRSFFKPLALMLPELAAVREYCVVSEDAARWLQSSLAPIVLLELRPGVIGARLSEYVAPNLNRLGVMLPYTPLHHLLLADCDFPLVMTSGNISDEPVLGDNAQARAALGDVADGFLLHDRPIYSRCDDSVLSADGAGQCTVLRHSRGFSPFPVALKAAGPDVLALGGDLKATFAASRGQFAFLSPHLGDADQLSTYAFFRETWEHYVRLFGLRPQAVACDLHPGYYTAGWAAELARELGVPLLKVQHHHAHLASLMCEHGLEGPHTAIVADGTGYGYDGTIWGGEVLRGDSTQCKRIAHLKPILLPGGDAAVREPWKIALALLHTAAPDAVEAYITQAAGGALEAAAAKQLPGRVQQLEADIAPRPAQAEMKFVLKMLQTGTQLVPSSALGRLFDGVAALLGVTLYTTYEGQGPMELEAAATSDQTIAAAMPPLTGPAGQVIDWTGCIRWLLDADLPLALRAYSFHQWVAQAFLQAALATHGTSTTPLLASGGCMQNVLLQQLMQQQAHASGAKLLLQRELPANDGGLALGVLHIARSRLMLPA